MQGLSLGAVSVLLFVRVRNHALRTSSDSQPAARSFWLPKEHGRKAGLRDCNQILPCPSKAKGCESCIRKFISFDYPLLYFDLIDSYRI